jgi:methyl-accepting chemotaxis protein
MLLLLGSVSIPAIAITQSIVFVVHYESIASVQKVLKSELSLLGGKLKEEKLSLINEASNLEFDLEVAGIDLDRALTPTQTQKLGKLIDRVKQKYPNRSFYVITDAQGKTVAQHIQIIDGDFKTYPRLASTLQPPTYRPVNLPAGINLGDVPIVAHTLKYRRLLAGVELIPDRVWQRLGLAPQANVGLREQETDLPTLKQPYPVGTYPIDGGKAGLAIMAVHPLFVDGKLVGTVTIGTLLNRNFDLIDRLQQETGASAITLSVQDLRISTNVPYSDGQTRAIGTRVAREVADRVLNQGEMFEGKTDIIGTNYFTGYSPIFDHHKILNPQARPVGIASIGEPEQSVGSIIFIGYGIGGAILLIAAMAIVPISRSFSHPLSRLTLFVQEVGEGALGRRLNNLDRQDEIGILSQTIDSMLANLEAHNIQQIDKVYRQAEIAHQRAKTSESVQQRTATQVEELTVRTIRQEQQIARASLAIAEITRSLEQIAKQAQSATEISVTEVARSSQTETAIAPITKQLQMFGQFNLAQIDASKQQQERIADINQVVVEIEGMAQEARQIVLDMSVEMSNIGKTSHTLPLIGSEIEQLAHRTINTTQTLRSLINHMATTTETIVLKHTTEQSQIDLSHQRLTDIQQNITAIVQSSREIHNILDQVSTLSTAKIQTATEISEVMEDISSSISSVLEIKR